MRSLTALSLPAIALLALAVPAEAAKSDAGGEVALHIEAEAAIPPDRAEITVALTGSGDSENEALADLKSRQAKVAKAFADVGLPQGAITNGDPKKVASNDMDAATMDAAEAASEAACDAAAAVPSRKSRSRAQVTETACIPELPKFTYTATSRVTITSLALLPKIRAKQTELGLPTYNYNTGTRFFASDPAAQAKLGREMAVGKARKEADDYAATLGYHVVRMTRVSNGSPPFGMRDLHTLVGYADYAMDQTTTPSFYGAATYISVGIDFVMVPN